MAVTLRGVQELTRLATGQTEVDRVLGPATDRLNRLIRGLREVLLDGDGIRVRDTNFVVSGMGRSGLSTASTAYNIYFADTAALPFWWAAPAAGYVLALGASVTPAASQAFTLELLVEGARAGAIEVPAGRASWALVLSERVPFQQHASVALRVTTPGTWTTTVAVAASFAGRLLA